MSGVPKKIIDGATVLMHVFETIGPGPKTGLTDEIERALGQKVRPRELADMIHYCRRVLGPQAGKAVTWSTKTGQYGFAENLEEVERYIILWNQKYMASRAETLAAVCGAAMADHGVSVPLAVAKVTHENYAGQLRAMGDSYLSELKAERAARRLGADAEIRLEERVA